MSRERTPKSATRALPDYRGRPAGAVDVEHLWKRFRADPASGSLRARVASKRPSGIVTKEKHRWVLRDVALHLEPGDAVGLIGANGSGKSTLLKILTGVMYPHTGRYHVSGRIGALLEVRAGLHGDLTGRENIYLYGGLLGLTKPEVARRFDEIVDFAALESAIDRQVKYYSSGMGMRLGFSVAAFLEPDVLLVDEALAVGDSFFQQRCLDRMRDLLRAGTSLVLVSHDMAAVESVCTRGVWLEDGVVRRDADIRTAMADYRTWLDDAYHDWIDESADESVYRPGAIDIVKADVQGPGGGLPQSQKGLVVDLVLDSPRAIEGDLCIGVTEGTASPMFIVSTPYALQAGSTAIRATLPFLPVAAGRYYLWVEFDSGDEVLRVPWQPAGPFMVEGKGLDRAPMGVMRASAIQIEAEFAPGDTG